MKLNVRVFLSVLIFSFAFAACGPEENEEGGGTTPKGQPAKFTRFYFRQANNPKLSKDVECNIEGDQITMIIRDLKTADGLIPTFAGSYEKVEVGGAEQQAGKNAQNFNNRVTYMLTGTDGNVKTYEVFIRVGSGLPVVELNTNGKPIVSKDDYVDGSISISKIPTFSSGYSGTMRIKGRGNATFWSYPKKPYRIKLDETSEILDMPSSKDWVLLAEYCDKSMLRNVYAFELSKLMGFPWTPKGYHVEVFLNGNYDGTYYLTEHVKRAYDRVNIQSDGYLIENDNYWDREPIHFKTNRGAPYTFKYPDTDDFSEGDETYNFIHNYMNNFEKALYSSNFKDPEKGYRQYVDVENFAKWYLLQETMGNIDTNAYYALNSRNGSKLQMYPVWDFEWSLGLASAGSGGWATPPTVSPVDRLWRRGNYFDRLFQDPYFVEEVKKQWPQLRDEYLPALEMIVEEKKDNIKYAQIDNFTRWKILGQYTSVGLTKYPTWQGEVSHVKNFLRERVAWLDTVIPTW